MRTIQNFNENWTFTKEKCEKLDLLPEGEKINLPHTWNALDGQDGGNDYYRGECWYFKTFNKPDVSDGKQVYIEFQGANSSAKVYLNSTFIGEHHGGYSTFRFNLTPHLKEENILAVIFTIASFPSRVALTVSPGEP